MNNYLRNPFRVGDEVTSLEGKGHGEIVRVNAKSVRFINEDKEEILASFKRVERTKYLNRYATPNQ